MKYLFLLFVFCCLAGCDGSKRVVDLEAIANSKNLAFQYVNYRSGQMDYTYCQNAGQIVKLVPELDGDYPRVIVVCLALNETFPRAKQRSVFYKLSEINQFGKVTFCGWKDHHYKLNDYLENIDDDLRVGSSEKCKNFSVWHYFFE